MDRMESLMKNRHLSTMNFYDSLFRTLDAESMAVGLEVPFEDLFAFIKGKLGEDDVRECIYFAVGVAPRSLEMLRTLGGSDFAIASKTGVARPMLWD